MSRIKILSFDAICCESWAELDSNECKICKNDLQDLPVDYKKDSNNKRVTLCKGKCGHVFHSYCMKKIKKNDQQVCPTCCVTWILENNDLGGNNNWKQFTKSDRFLNNISSI